MEIGDIEGTKSRPRVYSRPRNASFSNIDYTDVTKTIAASKRQTNPLMPVYQVTGDDGKLYEIGDVEGSKPARMPSAPRDKERSCLNTKDIDGAQTSTKGLGIFAHVTRKDKPESKNLNTADIYGAQTGSLKKGPQTKRITNPLEGNY
jgi:hypothetical protein